MCKVHRMSYYRRRLPHWIPDHSVLFVTWRLAGCLPAPPPELLTSRGTARASSVEQDERLAHSSSGPFWLRDPKVAAILEEALRYGETVRQLYLLHAWVIMPNHVHVIMEPHLALSQIMHWLKGRTGRKANQLLGRRGLPFWQEESYDHWVRTTEELNELIRYVESNPVQAGLVEREERWPWSSAHTEADDTLRSSAPPAPSPAHERLRRPVAGSELNAGGAARRPPGRVMQHVEVVAGVAGYDQLAAVHRDRGPVDCEAE